MNFLGTPFNRSGKWEGIMGGIVSGKYDICPMQWLWTVPRARVLSFATFTTLRNVLLYIPQNPTLDWRLFFRPLNRDVWAIMVTTLVISITGLLIHRRVFAQDHDVLRSVSVWRATSLT